MQPFAWTIKKKLIRLAWRNVLRNWRHGLATTLAIAIGFMAISLFDGFIRELILRSEDGFANKGMLGDLLIEQHDALHSLQEDPWKYALNRDEQQFLEEFFAQDPDFAGRVRFLHATGMLTAGSHQQAIFVGFGYDVEAGKSMRGPGWTWNTTAGKPMHLAPRQSLILGSKLGELLGCHSSFDPKALLADGHLPEGERDFHCDSQQMLLSASTEAAQVNTLRLSAAGLFDAGYREATKRAVHMSLEDAQKLLDTDKITMISVRLRDAGKLASFRARLLAAAEKKGFHFDATPWRDHPIATSAKGGIEILSVFRNLFMTIVLMISVMAVANTMMKAVNERIQEIGTLRSLGYLAQQITFIFACEGLFISIIACTIGLLLSLAGAQVIAALGITYKAGLLSLPIHLRILLAPAAWAWSGGLLSLLASFTAWFCARGASRLAIAEAVHHR